MNLIPADRADHPRSKDRLDRRGVLKLICASSLAASAEHGRALSADRGANLSGLDGWDLRPLFQSPADWEAARQTMSAEVDTLKAFEAEVRGDPTKLSKALVAVSNASRGVDRLRTYADCSADADTTDRKAQDRSREAGQLLDRLVAQTAWIDETVAALGSREIAQLLAREPDLARFRFDLEDRLRLAPHRLSVQSAGLIAAARPSLDAPSALYNALTQIARAVRLTDSQGQAALLTAESFRLLPPAKDQAERSRRSEATWRSRGQLEEAFAATLDAAVRESLFEARARGYSTSLEAALSGPNIPVGLYETMIAETDRALPVLHRYYGLRRRMLGLSEFRLSDRSVPLTSLDRRYSLSSMRELTVGAVQPLGAEYAGILAQATLDHWMDALPRPTKRDAIYTNPAAYDVHPFLLLNLGNTYVDLTLFAHEWGHAMHSVLVNRTQPFDLANAPVLTRETASTTNEQLLVKDLVAKADTDTERLDYLAQQMEGYSVIFFNNAMMAKFESAIHQIVDDGGSLSGPELTSMYGKLQSQFYGPDVVVDAPHGREWMYVPHFSTPFYNFQYVPCIAAAAQFSDQIRSGDARQIEAYLRMLKAGGADFGYNLLYDAGVDLARPEPYRALVRQFSDAMDTAEGLINAGASVPGRRGGRRA